MNRASNLVLLCFLLFFGCHHKSEKSAWLGANRDGVYHEPDLLGGALLREINYGKDFTMNLYGTRLLSVVVVE